MITRFGCLIMRSYMSIDQRGRGVPVIRVGGKAFGADATAGLRKRRQQVSTELEAARAIANQAANERTLADERTRHSGLALDAALAARHAPLPSYPEGVDP